MDISPNCKRITRSTESKTYEEQYKMLEELAVDMYGELTFPTYDEMMKIEEDVDARCLNNKIATYREIAGISNKDLAGIMKISVTSLEKYISGERVPSVKVALKLAKFFNIAVEELYSII